MILTPKAADAVASESYKWGEGAMIREGYLPSVRRNPLLAIVGNPYNPTCPVGDEECEEDLERVWFGAVADPDELHPVARREWETIRSQKAWGTNPSVGEAIREAVAQWDAIKAGKIVDFLRFKGMNYQQTFELFQKITGITESRFEELMYEADYYGSHGNNPERHDRGVHPLAFVARDRYRADLHEPGHEEAAEYWRGQAGAFFTGNPLEYYPAGIPDPAEEARAVRAFFSRMRMDEEVDAWGASRATGAAPLLVESELNKLVAEGLAEKSGNWYSRKPKPRKAAKKKARKKAKSNPKRVAGGVASGRVKSRKAKKNRTAAPGRKKRPAKRKRYSIAEARKKFKGVDEAVRAYKRFHGRDPKTVDVYEIEDGSGNVTVERAHAALHRTIDTNYFVPWESNKKDSLWKHQHVEGYDLNTPNKPMPPEEYFPLEILDPATGTTRKIAGRFNVSTWWFD